MRRLIGAIRGASMGHVDAHVESCAGCGFVWDDMAADAVAARLATAVAAIGAELDAHPALVENRPTAERWSMLEYAAHVRDVILVQRDRLVLGAVEDRPSPAAMYRDERVALGLYADDTADVVADELAIASALFSRTFDALTPALLTREIEYRWPTPTTRTLRWIGAQTVHEAEHHLADIVEDRQALRRSSDSSAR